MNRPLFPQRRIQSGQDVPTSAQAESVSPWCLRGAKSRQRAVALVIVLSFVVLLTGLLVAFFSRAMAERQVSNNSVNSTRVSLLAEGAVDQLIVDAPGQKQQIWHVSSVRVMKSPEPKRR